MEKKETESRDLLLQAQLRKYERQKAGEMYVYARRGCVKLIERKDDEEAEKTAAAALEAAKKKKAADTAHAI